MNKALASASMITLIGGLAFSSSASAAPRFVYLHIANPAVKTQPNGMKSDGARNVDATSPDATTEGSAGGKNGLDCSSVAATVDGADVDAASLVSKPDGKLGCDIKLKTMPEFAGKQLVVTIHSFASEQYAFNASLGALNEGAIQMSLQK